MPQPTWREMASTRRLSNIEWRCSVEIDLFVVVIVGGATGSSLHQ
jgi:hypothetical protein